jgi:hypothetical protein
MRSLDRVRLPLTILLGALIIGGVIGVVGINMQPKYDDSTLQPITVEAPRTNRPAAPPPVPATPTLTPITAASITTDVPAPPPATFDPVETTDDGGHHRGRGGDDRGGDDGGNGGGDRSGSNSGPG